MRFRLRGCGGGGEGQAPPAGGRARETNRLRDSQPRSPGGGGHSGRGLRAEVRRRPEPAMPRMRETGHPRGGASQTWGPGWAEHPEGSLGYRCPRVCVHRPGWGLRVRVSNGPPETLLVRGLCSRHAPPHPTYNSPLLQPPAPPANTDAPAQGGGSLPLRTPEPADTAGARARLCSPRTSLPGLLPEPGRGSPAAPSLRGPVSPPL